MLLFLFFFHAFIFLNDLEKSDQSSVFCPHSYGKFYMVLKFLVHVRNFMTSDLGHSLCYDHLCK